MGECLGLAQNTARSAHVRRSHSDLFPAMRRIHCTMFVCQAANLWQVVLAQVLHDPRFARAYRCRLFRGEAAYGHDELNRRTFYGFRCHVRGWRPEVIAAFSLAPANASDRAVLPELVEGSWGFAVGDRNS